MLSFQQKSASSRDVSVVEHLLPTHTFYHITLDNNNWGGIGIYISNEITNVIVNSSLFRIRNFQMLFMNEKKCISIRFLDVHKSPVDNISALVQIMAWCRIGDKPLS